MSEHINDPMLELFIYETSQQLEQLEQSVMKVEIEGEYSSEIINEIFRIMHTMKSSAAMMLYNNISRIAHATEDVFYFLREQKPKQVDSSSLCDMVLEGIDFIKIELEKITNGQEADGEDGPLIEKINAYLTHMKEENAVENQGVEVEAQEKKQFYIHSNKAAQHINKNTFQATIRFEAGCEMENIRAFTVIHNLKDITEEFYHIPEDITDNHDSCKVIQEEGFVILFKTDQSYEMMYKFFMQTAFLEHLELKELDKEEQCNSIEKRENEPSIRMPEKEETPAKEEGKSISKHQGQNIISVNVEKLDKLMDLMGEMVIAEAMVIQNPDLKGLNLENFQKATRQFQKITGELQDIVMSMRMVSLAPTFLKMNRIVRDMSKKLSKEVHLEILGEDTEVDKNIIEHIGDPLMHLVRNAIDHGIELPEERENKGKPREGTLTLEAKNAGSEVLIIIRDDGKGLSKEKILKKAMENGVIKRDPEGMTEKEIFNLILLPGFSTKEVVTEFSGRGVGMDVVAKNIETIGGSIQVESTEGMGTTIILKIPLTLAIINGMNIRVGKSRYTLPTIAIKESFRPEEKEVFQDPDGNEMILIRGSCYPVLRIHEMYRVKGAQTKIHEGIMIMIESENKSACLFADELLGEQQVVVKTLPKYITNIQNVSKSKKITGIAGCTLLGDGSISLILDIGEIIEGGRRITQPFSKSTS